MQGNVRGVKISNRQKEILKAIRSLPFGMWSSMFSHIFVGDEWVTIRGAGDANAIKSLWRKGLLREVKELPPYSSEITPEGIKYLDENI